jgi:DNA-binding NarL/FixJ family response regulator
MRVLVVDDHPLYREALCRTLEREGDVRVVGHVGTGQEAIAAAKRLHPDLVLVDVELPDMSGIDVVRRLSPLEHPPLALMVSAFPESGHVVAAMKAGARGYLAKTADGETLVEAMRAVARGATIFDSPSGAGLWTPRQLAQLTRRELDVLRLVGDGKTNAEIADELCLAKKTVERIVATAVAKLRARNRAHAVAKAVALKVIDVRAT